MAHSAHPELSGGLDLRPIYVHIPPAHMPPLPALAAPLDLLRATLPREVASWVSSARELPRPRREERMPTGLFGFDTLLEGGLPKGKLVELTGRPSGGRFSVALAALAVATGMGETAALVDLGDHLDPKLAAAAGVDLPRLLWLRPRRFREALEAAEIAAGTGFALLVLDLGLSLRLPRGLDAAPWLRLARLAGVHGTALLVSTPFPLTGLAAEAVIRVGRGRIGFRGIAGTLLLEKQRHRKPGETGALVLRFDWSLPGEPETRGPPGPLRGPGENPLRGPEQVPALRTARWA
ncbi:MAG TPA: hypothetical protein VF580_09715 [Thermoanaerobaculia bacterium]